MKNTRRAAAAWMTMSLAVSTVLGNTAWGDVLQETGKNRCVHVHTAECYGDADETATMSQTGELEPTECTHVCSVESGCILDTEDLENNDADAWKVGTPSNAEDTTINPGGTVTPAVQTKILSWTWFDPEENLLDGRLELTGITEEAQPSFTEVTEYLPQAIIAQVGEGEDWEEKNLQITNWTCTEYVQDEEGRWPLEGTYEFKAELEEGYELADGVDALVVEVSVVGDQAAVIDDGWDVLRVSPASGEQSITLKFNGADFWSYNNGFDNIKNRTNITVESFGKGSDGQYKFRLTLNNTSASNIIIASGDWEIVLNGNNQLDGKGKSCGGIGLYIIGWGTHATIVAGTGDASLNVSNYPTTGKNLDGSSGIQVEARLTIESGTIITNANRAENNNLSSGAIYVTSNGTLNINGGEVIATGNGKYGLCARGTINMSRGKFDIIGNGIIAVDHEPNSNFTLSGGTITITSKTGHTGLSTKGNLTIKGGTMNVNILEIVKDTTMTVEGGILETGGIKIGDNGKLINKGELIANGNFEGNGTIENTGTISGSGNVPDGVRRNPGDVGIENSRLERNYSEEKIDVQSAADVTAPNQYVKLFYSIDESESTGIGTIDSETGKLTVKKAGIFKIKVKTLATGVYIEGTPAEITLTVNKADFPNDWNLTVNAVNKTYDGKKVAPATITSNIPQNVNASYQYQLAATRNANLLEDNWDASLTVKDVADSYKYVFVRVVTDNYKSKIFDSSQQIEISRRTFKDVGVTITPDTVTYNGDNWKPQIKVTEDWLGDSGDEVDSSGYKIDWTNEEGRTVELKDAGTYTARLMGTREGNYLSEVKTASFTIEKCKLKAQITGDSFDKVYDGTTDITEEQKLAIQLYDDNKDTPAFQDVHADQVKWAYQSADVGERDINATITSLAGDQAKNYELTEQTVSQKGTIKPRDFASMTVSAAPLTYNGTEQQPKINASVETGLEKVSPDAVFTYSKDGVNYQNEIPGFTEAGTYLVYVKASMANFKDAVKTVAVTVTPKESSSGGNSGNNSGNNSGSNSGNNSGTSTSGGSSSNNGSSNNGNSGNGSSSSDRDRSDRDDSNASVVKVSPSQSGKVTKDSQKGYRNEEQGVITGANNQAVNDGYSHWMKDAKGWWLRYSDGTWPMGRAGAYHWEKINGRWWAFGADGYISSGWIYDTIYQGWFYMDENQGMLTGWQFINGKWYYLNPNSDGTAGIMYTKRRTPDGWYVKEDGSRDEEAGR